MERRNCLKKAMKKVEEWICYMVNVILMIIIKTNILIASNHVLSCIHSSDNITNYSYIASYIII